MVLIIVTKLQDIQVKAKIHQQDHSIGKLSKTENKGLDDINELTAFDEIDSLYLGQA